MTGKQAAMKEAEQQIKRARLIIRLRARQGRPLGRPPFEAMLTAIWLMQSVASQ